MAGFSGIGGETFGSKTFCADRDDFGWNQEAAGGGDTVSGVNRLTDGPLFGDAFSLTLALSRWERECVLDAYLNFVGRGAEGRRGFALWERQW